MIFHRTPRLQPKSFSITIFGAAMGQELSLSQNYNLKKRAKLQGFTSSNVNDNCTKIILGQIGSISNGTTPKGGEEACPSDIRSDTGESLHKMSALFAMTQILKLPFELQGSYSALYATGQLSSTNRETNFLRFREALSLLRSAADVAGRSEILNAFPGWECTYFFYPKVPDEELDLISEDETLRGAVFIKQ
ncbi:hypothetical protein ACSBR2_017767 [Camellia fascicularis]